MRTILCISRELGVGGREIGQRIAKDLGFGYYDRELVSKAAMEMGFDHRIFEESDETTGLRHFLQNLTGLFTGRPLYDNYISNDMLFKAQSDTIRRIAENGSSVIMGRCSDYILRDEPGMISVFLYSPLERRIKRVKDHFNMSESKARTKVVSTERKRAAYYNYYTGKTWGAPESYHLMLDVSLLGIEKTVDVIENYIKNRIG